MVQGPPFYDENEWGPDQPHVEKTFPEWMSDWTQWGSWGNSAAWHPASPGGELHGHRVMDADGKIYVNVQGEWMLDDS